MPTHLRTKATRKNTETASDNPKKPSKCNDYTVGNTGGILQSHQLLPTTSHFSSHTLAGRSSIVPRPFPQPSLFGLVARRQVSLFSKTLKLCSLKLCMIDVVKETWVVLLRTRHPSAGIGRIDPVFFNVDSARC